MRFKGLLLGCAVLPLLAAPACVTEQVGVGQDVGYDTEARNDWLLDMRKIDAYGRTSKVFFGLAPSETGLPPNLPGGDQVVWDQTAKKEADHTMHVESGTDYAVIDADGNYIDPVGYVHIVPMLKDTDPVEQVHIKEMLRDGDVLVYFHPEYLDVKNQLERRASHVAMHYEVETGDGRELVHHIDNPNSYGPRYNHRPTKHMPFHVYRFQPREDKGFSGAPASVVAVVEGVEFSGPQQDGVLGLVNGEATTFELLDDTVALNALAADNIIKWRQQHGAIDSLETLGTIPYVGPAALARLRDYVGDGGSSFTISNEMAADYGLCSRNWAMITNDLSPFADFFTLTLKQHGDLWTFAENAIHNQNMPRLYCSGLAYANLNLAVNYPLNPQGLGPELWATFNDQSYAFSDSGEHLQADRLAAAESLRGIDRLVFEPYAATDIVNAWVEVNMGSLPMPVRQQLLQNPQLQQMLVGGMSQLEWSDDAAPEKQQAGQWSPATLENVGRWARAYGLPAEATADYLAADPALAASFDALGIPLDGLTPMDVIQAVEASVVDNRFVPPRIWMDEADDPESDMIYVATVLNCELLSAADGSSADACALSGSGDAVFREGAADTSTYPHYAVPNGRERTHRRFDASPGPALMGPDTTFTLRATTPAVDDLLFLLHVPAHYEGHPTAEMAMMDYDHFCTAQNQEGGALTCAPEQSIVLDPTALGLSGLLDDHTMTFRLGDLCTMNEDGQTMTCPLAKRNGLGQYERFEGQLSRNAHGWFALTMVDLGNVTSAAELPNCVECPTGGAHYNQWVLDVR